MLQCYPKPQSGMSVLQSESYVVVFPCGCCDVHLGLGLNCMQYLGVEEMPNGLDKPSVERSLTKR